MATPSWQPGRLFLHPGHAIAFRPKDQKFEVTDAAIRKDLEWIPDISELWSGSVSRNRFVKDYFNRLRASRGVLSRAIVEQDISVNDLAWTQTEQTASSSSARTVTNAAAIRCGAGRSNM